MKYLIALALLASTAAHAQQTYEDRAAWETAASGTSTTYTFVGLEHNQPVGLYQGLVFEASDDGDTDGTDYPIDGFGVDGNGRIHVTWPIDSTAVAVDFPGSMRIALYASAESYEAGIAPIYVSDICGPSGGPPGQFCGVILPANTPAGYGIFEDFYSGVAKFDNLEIITPAGPQPLVVCATGALAVILMEWTGTEFTARDPVATDGDCMTFTDVIQGNLYLPIPVVVMP
jgi:hypothetical protein